MVRHAVALKSVFRVLFGVVWLIDGYLKFQNDFVGQFPGIVQTAQSNAPGWLQGWYAFWAAQATANPAGIVDTTGALELALGIALVFGLGRKLAYAGGTALSLLIWAVPEGFGGSYGPGTTDVGVGVVYAMLFLGLAILNATYGPSRWSLDAQIERRWPGWARIAEFAR